MVYGVWWNRVWGGEEAEAGRVGCGPTKGARVGRLTVWWYSN